MANNQKNIIMTIVICVLVVMGFQYFGTEPAVTDNGSQVDLSNYVSGQIELYAKDKYVGGTAITAADENATIIEGDVITNGKSINAGTYDVEPNKDLIILFGAEDSTTVDDYYAAVVNYNVRATDSKQKVVGEMCQVDTNPTITVKNSDDQVQTASANAQALGADDKETVTIKVKAGSDECYGNPDAEGSNAICFKYNTTAIQKIETNSNSVGIPYQISSLNTSSGYQINCFALDKLADLGFQELDVTIQAASSEPGVAHNISVLIDDIAVDVDGDTSEVLYGFQDEDNNALGASPVYSKIYIA